MHRSASVGEKKNWYILKTIYSHFESCEIIQEKMLLFIHLSLTFFIWRPIEMGNS